MDARLAKRVVMDYVRAHSRFENRSYLGMSQIGRCPRWLYTVFLNGKAAPTDRAHLNSISGYMYEEKVAEILMGTGMLRPTSRNREIVAAFDERFRGHIDGELVTDALLEIKSMGEDEFSRFAATGDLKDAYICQVQCYMRYGRYRHALIVAVCRATFDLWFGNLVRDDALGDRMEMRAKSVLAAIDKHEAPTCICGCCREGV